MGAVGAAGVGETPSLTGEFVGETHRVQERTQNHPTKNPHQKGPNCLQVAGEILKTSESQASSIVPSMTPPPHTAPNAETWVALPWPIPKAPPLTT